MRIIVLGAGFGGLELATRLGEALGDSVEVTLVDRADHFVFGFSKLDVMFGRRSADEVRHRYRDVVRPGVRFIQADVLHIDPRARRVRTSVGDLEADRLVVALGADLDLEATPGLAEGGVEFYSVAGAFAARETIADFPGGRVVVGLAGTPFKCPAAPSETALLMHDHLVERGLRAASHITLVMPFGTPIPPSPDASAALLAAFAERGIAWVPDRIVRALDVAAHQVVLDDGSTLPYDLYLGVPLHRAPQVVLDSPLAVDGWIPVDPRDLTTAFAGVYAVGDVTSVGTPKAGVFAEGQAAVVADQIIAMVRGTQATQRYGGRGVCYLEFGDDRVAKVDVTFPAGGRPHGELEGPSPLIAADKAEFAISRISRWFPAG